MEPIPSDREPTFLAEVRRRRAELVESMRAVEQSLAAPAPGRASEWAARVHVALVELSADLRTHIDVTEGPQGLYGELTATAPRLAGAVERLSGEHTTLTALLEELITRVEAPVSAGDVDSVRERTTALLAMLHRHRQRGSDVIYEAYETDIGGET